MRKLTASIGALAAALLSGSAFAGVPADHNATQTTKPGKGVIGGWSYQEGAATSGAGTDSRLVVAGNSSSNSSSNSSNNSNSNSSSNSNSNSSSNSNSNSSSNGSDDDGRRGRRGRRDG